MNHSEKRRHNATDNIDSFYVFKHNLKKMHLLSQSREPKQFYDNKLGITTDLYQHILNIAYRHNKEVTNSQLQKVMFFSIGLTLRDIKSVNDKRFIFINKHYSDKNDFHIEKYGALSNDIYNHLSLFEGRPINIKSNEYHISDRGYYFIEFDFLDDIILRLLDVPYQRLIKLNLNMPHYKEHFNTSNRVFYKHITLNDIIHDFKI